MEAKEQEKLYASAQTKIGILEVITQPEDLANACKEIASLLKKAGDYKDAQALAEEYQKKAKELQEKAKQVTYDRALKILSKTEKVSDYDRGIKILKSLGDYKDAQEQAEKFREKKLSFIKKNNILLGIKGIILIIVAVVAIMLVNNWLNQKAMEQKESIKNDVDNVFAKAVPGDELEFGNYEWKVIDRDADSLKLVAIHIDRCEELMNVSYSSNGDGSDWEHSDIREWLNGEFLAQGFSEKEQNLILTTDVETKDNSVYGTKGGQVTQDQVYLPSEDDIRDYWMFFDDMSTNMWLRTPGNVESTEAFLSSDHEIMLYGVPDGQELAVRPMLNVAVDNSEEKELDLSENKVGDTVKFGVFKWKILVMDEEKAVLIAVNTDKYPEFSPKAYHDAFTDVSWEKSAIRTWLNGEFLQTNFTDSEQDRILTTEVVESVNSTYQTKSGSTVNDKVYLLSAEEAEQYWAGLETMSLNWILRTPGNAQNTVAYVSDDHIIDEYGCAVTDPMYIRPVIQISK